MINPVKPVKKKTQAEMFGLLPEEQQGASFSQPLNPIGDIDGDTTNLVDPFSHNSDNSNASGQSNWQAGANILFKGIAKTGLIAGNAVVGTLDGLVEGALNLVNNVANLGNVDNNPNISVINRANNILAAPIEGFVNNKFSKLTDDISKWVDESLPVYETKEDAESILPMNLKTVDKIANGIEYIAGTILGGKGINAIKNTALATKVMGKLFKTAAENGKTLDDVAGLFKDADDYVNFLKNPSPKTFAEKAKALGNVGNNLIFGEATEAGAEARETGNAVTEKLTAEYLKLNGGSPLTKEQKQDIKNRSDGASAWNFATNMAVLKATETVGLGLLGKNKWLKDVVNTKNVKAVDGVLESTKQVAKSSARKLFEAVAPSVPVATGLAEEGAQEFVQFGSNDFFVNLYTHKNTEDKNTGEYFAGAMESIFPALQEVGQGIVDKPKEAVESALIGGLIGAAGGKLNQKSYNAEKQAVEKRTQAYIDYSNSLNSKVQQSIGDLAGMSANAKAMQGAVFNGDRVLYETLKDKHIVDFVQSRLKVGQFDDVVNQFRGIKEQDLDEFNKQFGTDLDEAGKAKMSDTLIEAANRVKASNDKIMSNYGHKIIELEDKGATDVLPFLIQMDLTKDNLVKRESDLITKFIEKGIDYTEFQHSAATGQNIQQKKTEIAGLYSKVKEIDDSEQNIEEKNRQKKSLFDEILAKNNELSALTTNENYKEQFQKLYDSRREFLESKESGKNAFGEITEVASVLSTPFTERIGKFDPNKNIDSINDIRDFIDIQKAKERVFENYNKIVNNADEALKVQNKINTKNKKDAIQQLFTINGNVNPVTDDAGVVSDRDFELSDGDGVSDFISEGDFYQLKSSVWRPRVKGSPEANVKGKDGQSLYKKYSDIYEPVEVIKTNVNFDNGQVSGSVTIRPTGSSETRTIPVDQFKKSVKPVSKDSVKLPFNKGAKDFYKKFANRAIVTVIDGKEETGFIRPEFLKKNTATEVVDGKTVDKNPDFLNASQFRFSYMKDGKLETVSGKNIINDYVKVLDEAESLKYQLQAAIDNLITIDLDTDQKAVEADGKWNIYNSKIKIAKDVVGALKRDLASVQNLPELTNVKAQLEKTIAFYEAKEQVATEALNYFQQTFAGKEPVNSAELTAAFERLNKYKQAELTQKQAKAVLQASGNEASSITQDTLLSQLKTETDELRETIENKLANAPVDVLGNQEFQKAESLEAKLIIANAIQPDFVNGIAEVKPFYEKLDQYFTGLNEKNQGYYEELALVTDLTAEQLRDVKVKERDLLLNFMNFLSNRGFQYASEFINKPLDIEEFNNEADNTDSFTDEPTPEQRARYQEQRRIDNENDLIVSSSYDTRGKIVVAPRNAEESFFSEVANGGFITQPKLRVLRLTDLEKPEFKEVYDNLPETTKNPVNQDGSAIDRSSVILTIATDNNGEFRKTKDGNYIVSKYPRQAQADKRLNKQRQVIQDSLSVNNAPPLFVNVKPQTTWMGGFIKSDQPKPFNKASWGKGRFELPTTEDNKAGYGARLQSGRLYYQLENSKTFIPVGVSKIGNSSIITAESNGSLSPKAVNIVDNFIMGMKFLGNSGNKADLATFNTNFLNLLFYTKDGVFNVKYNDRYATPSNTRGIYLETANGAVTDEAKIREEVSNRLFNPSSKLLDKFKDKVNIVTYYTKDGVIKPAIKQVVNKQKVGGYEALLEQFNLNTFADKELFRNGSVEFGDVEKPKEKKPLPPVMKRPERRTSAAAGLEVREETVPIKEISVEPVEETGTLKRPTVKRELPAQNTVVGKRFEVVGQQYEVKSVSGDQATVVDNSGNEVKLPLKETEERIKRVVEEPATIEKAPAPKIRRPGRAFAPDTIVGNATRQMSATELANAKTYLSEYGVDVEIVSGLIDGNTWGLVLNSGNTLLSDRAIKGTEYHEEFHIVSQHVLSEDELADLYAEQAKNYPGLDNYQLEERLAEEHRLFKNGFTGFTGKIKYYFNKILRSIKGLVGIEQDKENLLKNQIFRNIYEGRYKGKPIHESTTQFYSKNPAAEIRLAEKRKIYNTLSVNIVRSLIDDYKDVNGFTNEVEGNASFLNDSSKRNAYLNEKIEDATAFDFFLNEFFKNEDNVLDFQGTTLESFDTFKDQFKPEFKQWLAKKIGFFIADELSQDELDNEAIANDTGSNQIVKKGDDETDHALDAVNQLNLLTLFSSNESDMINLPDFIGFVYNNIELSYDYDTFKRNFDNLKVNPKYDNIINMIRSINQSDSDNVDVIAFRNKLFSLFSKQENKFMVLKRFADGNLTFLNQAQSAIVERTVDKFKNEFRQNVKKFNVAELTPEDVLKVFGITDTQPVLEKIRQLGYVKNLNHIRDSIKRKKVLDIDSLFDFGNKDSNAGDIRKVVEAVIGVEESQRMFSVYNAEGNSQYALSNFSSLSKILEDRKNEIDIDGIVLLNGIQKQSENGAELDNVLLNQATEHDLHITTIKSVLDQNIVPFVFNGDKSSYYGIQMKDKILNEDDFWNIFKEEVVDLYNYVNLSDKISLAGNAFNATVFGFLDQVSPEYRQLKIDLANGLEPEFNTIRDGVRVGDTVITREQVMAARQANKDSIINSYSPLVRDDLGFGDEFDSKMNDFVDKYQYSIFEQQKLIGKLYFYKDPTKRTSAWNSAKLNMNLSNDFIEQYNRKYDTNFNAGNLRTFVTEPVESRYFEKFEGLNSKDFEFGDADDAQAHMTPEAFRFTMQSSGFWNQTLEDAYNTLESTDDLSVANKAMDTLHEQMSVLKLQYYDLRDVDGIDVPTFYKYSVVPLFKVLTHGKNIDKLREFMIANDFHQHVADTANKVGRNKQLMTLYNTNGEWNEQINGQLLDEQSEIDYAQVSPWKGIGIQVQMPMPHDRVGFGTQMRKLIDEDVQGDYVINGKNFTADELRTEHNRLIEAKIANDVEKFKKSFGLNDDFKLKDASSQKAFKKKLTKEISKREISLEFLKQLDYYQTYDGISSKAKLQFMLNSSIRNQIITQKMNGDAKAMMSSVGFEKGSISYDNRLKFYEDNGDGTTKGMEVLVPLTKQFEKYVTLNPETNLYEWNKNIDDDVKTIIGYRIPTQSQASIEKVFIKAFMPPATKNIVVVPFELTAKAGSDFDIDKLQMYYPAFKNVVNVETRRQFVDAKNLTKEDREQLKDHSSNLFNKFKAWTEENNLPLSNTVYDKDNLDNQIIRFYAGLLGSANMRNTMLGTIDNTQIKDIVKVREKQLIEQGLVPNKSAKENGWELANPFYSARRRTSFLQGKYALGATALAATHHAESQKTKLSFNNQNKIGNFKLSELLTALTGKTNWIDVRGGTETIPLDRIVSNEEIPHKISDYLSQLINACVDVAKDDYITSANYNLETSSVATSLIRMGVEPQKVVDLISHPEVIQYIRDYQQGSALLGDYKQLRKKPEVDTLNSRPVLQLYLRLQGYTDQLNSLMQITNFDTKGNGKTIEENEVIGMKIADLERKDNQFIQTGVGSSVPVRGNYSKLSQMFIKGNSPMMSATTGSFLNSFRNVVENANNFNSIVFESSEWFLNPVTPSQKEFQTQLRSIYNQAIPDGTRIPKGTAKVAQEANKFKNTFISYLMQQRVIDRIGKDQVASIMATLPQRINVAKKDNLFLQQLLISPQVTAKRIGDTEFNIDAISLKDSVRLKIDQIDEITESFYDLRNENGELANDIAIFSMFQSGIVNSPITINNIIPLGITQDLLSLPDGEFFLNSLMKTIDDQHDSTFVKNMMIKANPTEILGKQNTIYYRHFDDSIIRKVNDITKKLNKDCQ